MHRPNDKGVALTVVIVIIIILALLAGLVTTLGYNQKKLGDAAGGRRAKIYYRAKAGVVEAGWRIKNNFTQNLTAGSFLNDAYDPAPYTIDVDEDGVPDCRIDIGPVTNAATKQRSISSQGLDV